MSRGNENMETIAFPSERVDTSHRLALRPKEAAKALGIGERLLWSLTNRGLIPHLRLGKAILYPVDELRRYLAEQAAKGGRR